ncbi:MAG: threonyl-tRNA synthetase editing domain-containing protein, partial [Candidatus Nanohaloarchaea archaeon]|nr:threonyl-tRNA synthetase editing domain-containing protein [Candidatus Nanohaloarchaea archaeon]
LGGVERVVIFPWAHLADELADPGMARDLLDAFGQQVAGAGYETVQVPFGWYKEWELESKGHPMSVLSRSV